MTNGKVKKAFFFVETHFKLVLSLAYIIQLSIVIFKRMVKSTQLIPDISMGIDMTMGNSYDTRSGIVLSSTLTYSMCPSEARMLMIYLNRLLKN